MLPQIPSQAFSRSTYVTPGPTGFELSAQLATSAVLLPFFAAAFHESTPIGSYVLLFDLNAAGQAALANGALALLTLGPTIAAGATLLLSESVTEAPTLVPDPTCPGKFIEVCGFPFDNGCAAVLSSTPGRLTALANAPPGARFTARRQY